MVKVNIFTAPESASGAERRSVDRASGHPEENRDCVDYNVTVSEECKRKHITGQLVANITGEMLARRRSGR